MTAFFTTIFAVADPPCPSWETAITRNLQTFARWVSAPENRAARSAIGHVADQVCSGQPRHENNPFFLHGPSGTGKSHLVAALAHEVARRRPDLTIQVLAAKDARQQIASQTNWQSDLPQEWDLLILEDVQRVPCPAAETLVGIIDDRLSRQRQTVCTATVGPGQLMHLPARLTSRLAGGLVVGLTYLGQASRLAFLQDRIERRQIAVCRDVLAWLAEHLPGSARQLEGAVSRLETLVRTQDRIPDAATVAEHFRVEVEANRPTVERIAERVGLHFQVDPQLLQSRRRSRGALLARQVAMALARRLTLLSLDQIGAYFGGRDHSTVLHACRKVDSGRDAALSGAVRQLQVEFT
jgi:chromosomal replication initiator protein